MTPRGSFSIVIAVCFLAAPSLSAGQTFNNAAAFMAATNGLTKQGFETVSATNVITNQPINLPGGTTIQNVGGVLGGIFNQPQSGLMAMDGVNYLAFQVPQTPSSGSFLRINFSTPQNAFGGYFSDFGDTGGGQLNFLTNSGVNQNVASAPRPDGDNFFWGIVTDSTFTQIDIQNTGPGDAMGLDCFYSGFSTGPPPCVENATTLCLNKERFKVEVNWKEFQGNTGPGTVFPINSPDSGLFWFFSSNNLEMLVKVLDACTLNNRYWVFAAATTNVEYTITVTDTQQNQVKTYFNPLGRPAPAITDTSAFATCP